MKNRVTVRDIALHAGVSIGTVDRVMHNREGVAASSRQKVLEAMEQLGYQLNTTASLLANKKHYRICCLLPKYNSGDYWELVHNAITRAEHDSSQFNISIETISYDQFSRKEFVRATERLKDNPPQAVIMAPIYHRETIELSQYLADRRIPLVFIDSKVDEVDYLAYYGIPMFESGYLAASLLLGGDTPPQSIVNFRIERGATDADNPTLNRRQGFLDYVASHHPTLNIYNEFLRPYDKEYNFALMERFFAQHPQVRHIVTFNSRVHLIADYLAERSREGMTVVGFDLLERNCKALQSGQVRWLIVQRTEVQLRRGVNALAQMLAFGRKPAARNNFMPMDILTRENIAFYDELYKE